MNQGFDSLKIIHNRNEGLSGTRHQELNSALQHVRHTVENIPSNVDRGFDNLISVCSRNETLSDARHQELTSTLRLQCSAAENVTAIMSENLDGVQHISTKLDSFGNESSKKWDQLENDRKKSDNRSTRSLNSISSQIESVSNISSAQSSDIQNLLNMVQSLLLDQRAVRHEVQQTRLGTNLQESSIFPLQERNVFERDSLNQSIKRLCSRAAIKKTEFFSREAASIIDDLKEVVTSLSADILLSTSSLKETAKKHDQKSESDLRTERETQNHGSLRRIEDILRASRKVHINNQGKGRQHCRSFEEVHSLLTTTV